MFFVGPKCDSDICTKGHACKEARKAHKEREKAWKSLGDRGLKKPGIEAGKTQRDTHHAKHFSSLAAIKKTKPGIRPRPLYPATLYPTRYPTPQRTPFPPKETDRS